MFIQIAAHGSTYGHRPVKQFGTTPVTLSKDYNIQLKYEKVCMRRKSTRGVGQQGLGHGARVKVRIHGTHHVATGIMMS